MQPIRHVLLLCLVSSGCSIAISGPEPNRPRGQPPRCDTGKGLVGLDGVVATALAVGGIGALAENSDEAGAALISIGGAFLLAAVHGSSKANACREEMTKFALEGPRYDEPAGRLAQPGAPVGAPLPATYQPPPPQQDVPAPRQPPEQPPVQQTQATQEPPPPPVKQPPPAPKARDEWGDFWEEVP